MKKTHSLLLILGSIIFTSGAALAQSNSANAGSSYSAFGVGAPKDLTSAQFGAQGILGISGINSTSTSISNPALWGNAVFTHAITGITFSNFNAKEEGAARSHANLEAGSIQVVFPVVRNKLGLSIALYPYTRSNLQIESTQFFTPGPADTVSYTNEMRAFGGVNKFEVGLGLRLNKNISIGYAPSVAFLSMQNTEDIVFSSSGYSPQYITRHQSGAALSNRFGLMANFSGVLSAQDRLSFGATFNMPFTIGAKERVTAEKVVNNQSGQTVQFSVTNGNIDLPMELAAGLGYAPSRLVDFSAEGLLQKWSDYTNEVDPSDAVMLSDRMKVGFGGQFHPYRTNSDAFLSRFRYSAGVSYDTGHLTFQTDDISTLWLNSGLGILSRSFSSIDISFRYGFRGTTNNTLVQERIWALGFSVNLSEPMFARRRLN